MYKIVYDQNKSNTLVRRNLNAILSSQDKICFIRLAPKQSFDFFFENVTQRDAFST